MAVNETRSLNGDLAEGISDGVVRKACPDRGGVLEYPIPGIQSGYQNFPVSSYAADTEAVNRIKSL